MSGEIVIGHGTALPHVKADPMVGRVLIGATSAVEVARMRDLIARQHEMLKRLEWESRNGLQCPICGGFSPERFPNSMHNMKGHTPDCALAALIKEGE